MAIPAWFDAKAYFNNKLSQMNESVEAGGFDGTPGKVDSLALKAAFEAAGYTTDAEGLYQHFLDYGNAEGISPSALFDTQEYLYNKAADYYGTTAATPQMAEAMAQAISNVNMSAWDHYDMFWAENYAKDGTFHNPSANFDVAQYMQDKLAQVQAAEPDAGWTMDALVETLQNVGLSPIEHYYEFGAAEGLTVKPVGDGTLGNTCQLTSGTDTLVGTSGNDYFHADDGDLNSTDLIDGGAGTDTLYAIVEDGHDTVVNPRVYNVEKVLIQVEDDASGGTGDNLSNAWLDADRINLADGEILTIGSVNSRGDLTIEDIRHDSNETIIRFADSDPGNVNLSVYFDPQHLSAEERQTIGKLFVQLIDTVGALPTDLDGKANPLYDNPYTGFYFYLNGERYLLDFGVYNHTTDESPTYEELVARMQAAIDANAELSGLGLTVELGSRFTAVVGIGPAQGEAVTGTEIVISSDRGALAGGNWIAANGLPSTNSTSASFDVDTESTCPLISTTVELDNVGRVQWNEPATCLPDDIIYGSGAGDVVIGSMADRGGVERLEVQVDGGSWLSSLSSTNETLRMITVQGKDIDGDGTSGGNLYIGDWTGQGDQQGNQGGLFTWTDAARLLQAGTDVKGSAAGLIDVAVFDATDYAGDINIAAQITANSFDKYFKWVDGERYIDKMFAPLAGKAYDGAFSCFTGNGNDVINMTVDGAIAADNDFKMTINTGAGDDLVAFRFDDMSVAQDADQKNLRNVTINTGDGNDTVWFYGDWGGAAVINGGAGNDVIYANQQELFTGGTFQATDPADHYNAVFVFNTSVPQIGIDGLTGATLQNNAGVGASSFAITNAKAGEILEVVVTFKGIAASATVISLNPTVTFVSAEAINHAIIEAIANDPVLSNLLVARDGAGHSLLVESLINGQMTLDDLSIDFEIREADGTAGAGSITTGTWYETAFGQEQDGTQFTGHNTTTSQVVVNAGTGDDLIVLGPNHTLSDLIEPGGSFGNDTIVGFTRYDRINLTGILEAGKSLITNAGADALQDNAVVVVTDAVAADAENGIFTATEVQTLITEGKLGFGAAAADGATGIVFLQGTNAEKSNVYTVVQLTNGPDVSCSILGSITLDQSSGVASAITGDSFTLDSVFLYGNNINADSYAQLAGTDTTITLPDNANNICTGISTDNLKNADGLPITELNGGFTSNSFVVDGAISALLTINGGEGNNTFTVAGTDSEHVTISADLALTASGSGSNIFTVENVDIQIPDGALTITGGTGENTVVLGAGTDTIGADGISIMLREQGNNTLLLDGCKPDILSGNSINIESTDFVDSIVLGSSTTGTFALNNASWTRLTSLDATESDTKLSFTYDLAPEKPLEVLAGKNDDTFTIKTADFENITLDGGEGYDIVQLYAGNSPVEIDLADGHFTNIEKFSMDYRNQQGDVTLNLVAAETGITVDASNAKTLSTLIITTSTHGDDITLLGNVPMNATVILTPSLDAAGNYLEMDTSINFFMGSACGYADGCKNMLDVRAFDLSGDGEFTLWQKGGYTDAKGVFHKTSYCDATGKSVVLLGWIEKSDPANVYLTTDASDAGSASGNAVLVEEGESYLFLLAKESVAVSGNDIGMYRVEIGADGDAEWVHIGTLGVNTLGGDMLDLQADNFLCC